MPVLVALLLLVLVILAVRFPVGENLANWIVLLPMGTLFLGTMGWCVATQIDETFKSGRGFLIGLAVAAIPVAIGVQLINPRKKK